MLLLIGYFGLTRPVAAADRAAIVAAEPAHVAPAEIEASVHAWHYVKL